MSTKKTRKTRPVAPTHALDHALAALARNDAETCLRRAVPVLDDVGANAPALDLIARAAVNLGNMSLAREAFTAGARMLAMQGMAAHAIAAALSVQRLTGSADLLGELADVLSADAPRSADTSVRPPPLLSDEVQPLPDTLPRAELFERARARVEALAARLPERLPVRARGGLWGTFPRREFVHFAKALTVKLCRPGEVVIREGEHGGSVFVVARGEVRVVRKEPDEDRVTPIALGDSDAEVPIDGEELAVLGAETVFGEMALLTAAPRAASAVTTRATILLEASVDALEAATREVPALGHELAAWGRRRLVENLLRTAPLLRDVRGDGRATLTQAFETRSYEAGEALFEQGAEAVGLHLIASGKVVVRRREASGDELVVAVLGPGDSVGEISLVLRRPTSAAVVALEPTVAMILGPEQFMGVVRQNPALLASLYTLAVDREEQLHSVVAQPPEDADDLVIV